MVRKKISKEQIIKNIKPKEVESLIKNINTIEKQNLSNFYGYNKDFADKNAEDFSVFREKIKNVNNKYKEVTGDNVIEFFTKLAMEKNKGQRKINSSEYKESLQNITNVFNNTNTSFLTQLFANEGMRLKKYKEYEIMPNLIPQLNQILDIIADGIVSPDDYTKQIFIKKYDGKTTSTSKDEKYIFDNLRTIEKRYKIENKAKEIVRNTIIDGDQYYTTLPLEREFDKMLTESKFDILDSENQILTESCQLISETENKLLNEYFGDEKEKVNWNKEIINIVNNVQILKNPLGLFKEDVEMLKEEMELIGEETDIITDSYMTKDFNFSRNSLNHKKRGCKKKFEIDGTYFKKLKPEKLIKLCLGNSCFGYYYIENETLDNVVKNNFTSMFSNADFGSGIDIPTDGIQQVDPKISLLTNMLTNGLSKRLNKNFLNQNQEFKNIIYELIKNKYIIDKKIKIAYFSPDEIIHFKFNETEEGYGESILKPVIFTCKLYLAVLTTTLMLKLNRSVDHRTFYIEVGAKKDIEETIQEFIRQIKTNEINLSDLGGEIDTIFKNIGQFHDYFIPQVNGEKPLEMETTSGQDVTVENDLLEYLLKTIIASLNVPSSLIQSIEEVEFSRTLAMQNARFLRFIITTQNMFSETFTELYTRLYKNEYPVNDESFLENNLEIRLPSPASLNYSNISDQIGTVQPILDTLVQVIVGDNSDDVKRQDKVRRSLAKKFITGIDWDTLLEEIEKEETLDKVDELKDKLSQGGDEEDTDESSSDGSY